MGGCGQKAARIATVADNQFINHVFNSRAVIANNTYESNVLLDAFLDKCIQLR